MVGNIKHDLQVTVHNQSAGFMQDKMPNLPCIPSEHLESPPLQLVKRPLRIFSGLGA